MRNPLEVIRTARITEKNTALNEQGQYVFEVAKNATKQEIRFAVGTVFKKTVEDVRTMNVKGKIKGGFRSRAGRKPSWKKAIVTLKKGEKLDLV
jgi:large subunit ribosomal protein L23